MHQSIQSGPMALAASSLPISWIFQPKVSRIRVTAFLASSSLPQMKIVGFYPSKSGLYIKALPILLNDLASFACGIIYRNFGMVDGISGICYQFIIKVLCAGSFYYNGSGIARSSQYQQ